MGSLGGEAQVIIPDDHDTQTPPVALPLLLRYRHATASIELANSFMEEENVLFIKKKFFLRRIRLVTYAVQICKHKQITSLCSNVEKEALRVLFSYHFLLLKSFSLNIFNSH